MLKLCEKLIKILKLVVAKYSREQYFQLKYILRIRSSCDFKLHKQSLKNPFLARDEKSSRENPKCFLKIDQKIR